MSNWCSRVYNFFAQKPVISSSKNKLQQVGRTAASFTISGRMFLNTISNGFTAFLYLSTFDENTNWYVYGGSLVAAALVFCAYFFAQLKSNQFYNSSGMHNFSRTTKSARFGVTAVTAVVNFNSVLGKLDRDVFFSKNNMVFGCGLILATAIKIFYFYETNVQISTEAYKFREELLRLLKNLRTTLWQPEVSTKDIRQTISKASIFLTQLISIFNSNPDQYELPQSELTTLLEQIDQVKAKYLKSTEEKLSQAEILQLQKIVETLENTIDPQPACNEATTADLNDDNDNASEVTPMLQKVQQPTS